MQIGFDERRKSDEQMKYNIMNSNLAVSNFKYNGNRGVYD
jgi:hypothetical protein